MLKNVAYLAPEITSTSGTFVYKEIFALQSKGIEIVPISVHKSALIVQDPQVKDLAKNTIYLYEQSQIAALICSIRFFLRKPKVYLKTLKTVLGDLKNSGITDFNSWKLLYQFIYASSVAIALEQNFCQYLHIHFAHVPTHIGMYASLLTGIPFSFTSHANDIFENSSLLKEKVDRAKSAITISEYNHDFLAKQGVNPEKLKIVRCGIDTGEHDFNTKSTFNSPLKIGSLGRLIEKKGMDDLIFALSKLDRKGIDFVLEIGGSGSLNEYLKEIATKNNLNAKIKFKGAIPNDEVYSWLRELDIFILACKQDRNGDRDGIPVVLMEAMTAGIPVVSTKISGIPELIKDEESGFLAQPNDPESLANAIEKLLQSSSHLSDITQAARKRVAEEFELTTNVDRLLTIFNA